MEWIINVGPAGPKESVFFVISSMDSRNSCPTCHAPNESLRLTSHHCFDCHERCHKQCLFPVSVVPERQPFEEVASERRIYVCQRCCQSHLYQRKVVLQEQRGKIFRTAGSELSASMKLTMRGIEQFFSYLGIKEDGTPETYKRNRERFVFSLYKKMPEFLGGGSASSSKHLEVMEVVDGPSEPLIVIWNKEDMKLDADGRATVLLCFHGGAFIMGSEDTPAVLKMLASICRQTGVICISAGYRKAPENRFPSWAEDAVSAFEWTRDALLKLDAFPPIPMGIKICVMGDSAGGNIAAALAHGRRNEVHGSLLLYPILELAKFDSGSWLRLGNAESHLLLTRRLAENQCRHLFRDYPADAETPLASPLRDSDFSGLPPTHILVGAWDPLLDDSIRYWKKLKEASGNVTLSIYSTAPHGWVSFPQASEEQHEALQEIAYIVSLMSNRVLDEKHCQ